MIKKIILWTILSIMLVAGFFYINLIIFEKRGAIVTEGYPIENHQSDNVALLVIDIQEYNTGEISNPLINLMNSPLDREFWEPSWTVD